LCGKSFKRKCSLKIRAMHGRTMDVHRIFLWFSDNPWISIECVDDVDVFGYVTSISTHSSKTSYV
jgi:hypothetical protein